MVVRGRVTILFVLTLLCSATGVGLAPSGAAPTAEWQDLTTAVVPLPNKGVAYDHVRGKVLLAVAPSVPVLGNHLVEMDPHTGELGRAVFVGAEPRKIAVADDASRAYVALVGTSFIAEVDLATFTLSRKIALPRDSQSPNHAYEIEVQPGEPGVIAVSTYQQGIWIFDEGARRPVLYTSNVWDLAWSDEPGVLYGMVNYSVMEFAVDAAGVTMVGPLAGPFGGYPLKGIEFAAGVIHSERGWVIDPDDPDTDRHYGAAGELAVDEGQDAIFFLDDGELTRAKVSTVTLEWSIAVPDISYPGSIDYDLVDAGDVLVAAGGSSVLLIGDGVTSSGFLLPSPPESMVLTFMSHTAPVDPAALASSPDGTFLYGVVDANSTTHANQLVEIETATGAITRTVEVATNPTTLAISEDGSTILTGSWRPAVFTEVDVGTFESIRTLPVPEADGVRQIVSRPGAVHSFVAITMKGCCRSGESMILIQDGVIAPTAVPWTDLPTGVAFLDDPTILYGVDGSTTSYKFLRYGVTDAGVAKSTSVNRVSDRADYLVRGGDMFYANNGAIIDPAVPVSLGTVALEGIPAPVLEHNRHLMVASTDVHEFDLETHAPIASLTFGASPAVDAVRVGPFIAIATTTNTVFVPVGPDPRPPPSPPVNVIAADMGGWIDVAWDPPLDDGGAPVTYYTATRQPDGATCEVYSYDTSCSWWPTDMNGLAYSYTVTATSLRGTSAPSEPSNTVMLVGKPPSPTIAAATVGDGSITVTWEPPPTDGGSPLTGYLAEIANEGPTCSSTTQSCTIVGLTNGVPYSVRVRAMNEHGSGSWSLPFGPVTPTTCTKGGSGPFADVGPTDLFCPDIEWMAANEIALGYLDGTYMPRQAVSRQAIASFLYRYRGAPDFEPPEMPSFSDVATSHIFYVGIEWASAEAITGGYPDGTFRPGLTLNRQQLAAMLYRFSGSPAVPPASAQTFSDVPLTHPFATEIAWLAASGVALGFSDGSFGPTLPITRQASAAFLHRYDQLAL